MLALFFAYSAGVMTPFAVLVILIVAEYAREARR
jgi:hypothetical protein